MDGKGNVCCEGQMRKSPKQRLPWSVFCLDSVLLKIVLEISVKIESGIQHVIEARLVRDDSRERIGTATDESGAHFSDREESLRASCW